MEEPGARGAPAPLGERYELSSELGAGAMGTVFAAVDRRLDRAVAVKVLKRRATDVRLARMRREAQALAQLRHPNVVQVFDVGSSSWNSSRG